MIKNQRPIEIKELMKKKNKFLESALKSTIKKSKGKKQIISFSGNKVCWQSEEPKSDHVRILLL